MKNILIVVDLQNGFTAREGTNRLVEKVADLLKRNIFDVVFATKFMNPPGGRYERFLGWHRLQTEQEQAIREELMPYITCVVEKQTYNCISDEFLAQLKTYNGGTLPSVVYVLGADTDCCVQTIAVSLFEHDIRPIVLQAYCASNGGQVSHEAGLTTLKRTIGAAGIIPEPIESREQIDQIRLKWS